MKALSLSFTTMKPLMKPTRPPTTKHREDADRGRPFEAEAETLGRQDHHGADRRRNAVDRLERQVELAGDDDEQFRQDDERQSRRRGQDRIDIPRGEENGAYDGADDDQHRQRRKQGQVAEPSQGDGAGSRRERRFAGRQARGPNSEFNLNPLDRRDELVIAPTRRMLGDDLAVPHHEHPVADPQIFELAARHQDRPSLAARIFDRVQERFFRFHVDARGRINQNENRRTA